jgi:hypothetical protein
MSFRIVGYLKDKMDQVVIQVPKDIDIHWAVHKLNEAYTNKKNKNQVTYEETESEEDLDDIYYEDEILQEDSEAEEAEESEKEEALNKSQVKKPPMQRTKTVKESVKVSFK